MDKVTSLYKNKYYLIILIISATFFTHLFNPIGFPSVHIDEGIYMYRAMHLLTFGNLEWNTAFYDHPYFGPIILASLLYIINYPAIIVSDLNDHSSVELAYIVPRLIIGFFFILDTILLYAITKIHYNRDAAIISSLLFSIMPLTWAMRRIYLESILYPFLLSSILIVVYLKSSKNLSMKTGNFLILVSGIMLGLSIFTKAPLIDMIPLLTFYIYLYKRKIIQVFLFLIPTISIPLLWPIDAAFSGEFDQWTIGVISQLERQNDSILNALYDLYSIDPILLVMGLAGTIFAVIRRDFFLIMWIVPFLIIFSFFISYVNWFHLIPIFGLFCIASGVMIDWIIKRSSKARIIPISIISVVMVIGFFSTLVLISTNISSFQYQSMTHINTLLSRVTELPVQYHDKTISAPFLTLNKVDQNIDSMDTTPHYPENNNAPHNYSTVIISSPIYSWIYKFIYNYNNTFSSYTDNKEVKKDDKVILVLDRYFRDYLVNNVESRNKSWNSDLTTSTNLYNAFVGLNSTKYFYGTTSDFDLSQYPFTSMRFNMGGSPVEIRADL
ncbi:MAG: hypothetical protein L0H53_12545 [Candidatus Nitrosocosmicus sp.]|nr:hypothetical protein [Candidatus Nitrosocosmicus sp.]